MAEHNLLPSFNDLPLAPGDPPYSCWMWGPDDQLGTLNLLTKDRVKEAGLEIQIGLRVSLNWPLDKSEFPLYGRQPLKHDILHSRTNDDVNILQWYQNIRRIFREENVIDITLGRTQEQVESKQFQGTAAWAAVGIVGRGVLVDYYGWACANGKHYDPVSSYAISLTDLRACIDAQGVIFKIGDILVVRSGYVSAINKASSEQQKSWAVRKPAQLAGLEQSEEMLEFLFDNHFSAYAGDSPSFEVAPSQTSYNLHEMVLGGWGMPIGELFDLEQLSETCRSLNRWTFLFTSSPLHIPGGIASPPNALAIF